MSRPVPSVLILLSIGGRRVGEKLTMTHRIACDGGEMRSGLPEFAFYYPGPVWADAGWIKNLILFFDGVALLVPKYIRDKPFRVHPSTARELETNGLLTILEPESFINKTSVHELSRALTGIIASGALDGLSKENTKFHELSYSRLGYMADERLAESMYEELKKRGLATESRDGVSIPMHPLVRALILVLLSQILRPLGTSRGLDLQPATDMPGVQGALEELLDLPTVPSAGNVVSFDLTAVGVDVARVPLSKVLKFRERHHDDYRKYARDIRGFVRELSVLSPPERKEAFKDRKEMLSDAAKELRKISKKAWMKPASFSLGIAGAVWTLTTGDFVGGAIAMGGGLLGIEIAGSGNVGAHSYLFQAQSKFA